ncbi:MAG: Gfo/Idh/MocA family oxidoreductase [Planctomycetes bacterium]|nr:Gfo/Idh/MocA family oxidoreductase [Planctomycetota bacterium]
MMKVGLIGYGYWGPNILRNLVEGQLVEVVCCDLDEKKLQKIQARYPAIKTTGKAEDIFNDPEIKAVFIVTPISTHFSLAKKALEKGKNVFVEKPMAASVSEASELVKLAEKNKCTLMVGHTFEFSPPVLKIKEIINKGELGDIYFMSSTRVNLGLHQKDVSVIWDLAPHDFSIIFFLLDEVPTSVQAIGRDCVKKGIPDVAFIDMKFPSGIIVHTELSWLAPSKIRNTTIVGSKKMLVYDDTQTVEKIKLFDHGVDFKDPETFGEYQLSYRTGDIISPKLKTFEPLREELRHFIDCLKLNQAPRTDGESGLRVVKVLEAAEQSMKQQGKLISI